MLIACGFFVGLLTGCGHVDGKQQGALEVRPEAAYHAIRCFEAMEEAPGFVDPLPNPPVYFDHDESRCANGTPHTAACAGASYIRLVKGRWTLDGRNGTRVFAHEYLHVLYYRYTDLTGEEQHTYWEAEMNKHTACNLIVRRTF